MRQVGRLIKRSPFYKRIIQMVEEEKQPQEDLITQDGIKAVSDKGIDY